MVKPRAKRASATAGPTALVRTRWYELALVASAHSSTNESVIEKSGRWAE